MVWFEINAAMGYFRSKSRDLSFVVHSPRLPVNDLQSTDLNRPWTTFPIPSVTNQNPKEMEMYVGFIDDRRKNSQCNIAINNMLMLPASKAFSYFFNIKYNWNWYINDLMKYYALKSSTFYYIWFLFFLI